MEQPHDASLQRNKSREDSSTQLNAGASSSKTDLLAKAAEVLKAVVWLVILLFVIGRWAYFGKWLESATHVELPGVKVDRFVQASAKVEAYAETEEAQKRKFDLDYAKAAIVRAQRVAPAIKGALVLWVDEPSNNLQEMNILQALGIRFVTALSTSEAIERLSRDRYDLVISSVGRHETSSPLVECPVHYFAWPTEELQTHFKTLQGLNEAMNQTPPGGFSLMEEMHTRPEVSLKGVPPIVFYTGNNGGKVTSLCTGTITNRVDELLQSVVTNLEEQRWQELVPGAESKSRTDDAMP